MGQFPGRARRGSETCWGFSSLAVAHSWSQNGTEDGNEQPCGVYAPGSGRSVSTSPEAPGLGPAKSYSRPWGCCEVSY
eukprot:4555938-Pyramimonas_sp.AAC.1